MKLELPVDGFDMAWDMNLITWEWALNMRCTKKGTCYHTVTVGGKCYNSWDVNYLAYGWAANACGFSYSDMLAHVVGWKTIFKQDWERLPGAIAFSTLGYLGMSSPSPSEASFGEPSCVPCGKSYTGNLKSKWP